VLAAVVAVLAAVVAVLAAVPAVAVLRGRRRRHDTRVPDKRQGPSRRALELSSIAA